MPTETNIWAIADLKKHRLNIGAGSFWKSWHAMLPQKILEVGCGVESLADYYATFTEFTIVEPVKDFIDRSAELGWKARWKARSDMSTKNLKMRLMNLKKKILIL